MAAQDVAIMLLELEDETVRGEIVAGKSHHFAKAKLSHEEAAMIRDAAKELHAGKHGFTKDSAVIRASVYAAQGQLSVEIKPRFDKFLKVRFGGDIGSFAHHNWAYA